MVSPMLHVQVENAEAEQAENATEHAQDAHHEPGREMRTSWILFGSISKKIEARTHGIESTHMLNDTKSYKFTDDWRREQ